jgi:streptogramin lyase
VRAGRSDTDDVETRRVGFFVAIVLTIAAPSAIAHPSVGIVVAPDGSVFYSDLEKVWRVTPQGAKQIAVPNVHTHELWIDAAGAIYGEDSRWLGGDRYRHRIWKRSADGTIIDEVPWRDGFWREYGFTRDAAGTMYWADCSQRDACTVRKRDRSGRILSAVSGRFNGPINWITATPAGEVYVIDGPDLRRINKAGRIETVARISSRTDNRHHLMGLTLDRAGNVYVAVHGDRTVVRVNPSRGVVRVVAHSTAPWAPSGVAVTASGDLWILEWNVYETRIRRVTLQKRQLTPPENLRNESYGSGLRNRPFTSTKTPNDGATRNSRPPIASASNRFR